MDDNDIHMSDFEYLPMCNPSNSWPLILLKVVLCVDEVNTILFLFLVYT